MSHHRTLPVKARFDLCVVATVAIQAATGRLQRRLTRLRAWHPDQWIFVNS
ncbi:MAG: hypothetical protein PVF74_02175 [Anaerolineales bacterium]